MRYFWTFIFLILPLAGQYYVSLRVWQLLPAILPLRIAVVAAMAVAFISFFLSLGGLGNHLSIGLATVLYEVGNSWLIILLYMAMLFGVLDLAMVTHLIPRHFLRESIVGSLSVFVFLTALFTYAYAHFNHKERVEMMLNTHGKVRKDVKLVLISDIHLGYHNRRSDLHRWLQQIMRDKPDAILIAGDLVDGSIRPVNEDAFGPYQKGNTRYYVSSGLGIWGGKFRIGTQSEYVVVQLK